MQINVYNTLSTSITINELVIEPMHNFIPIELWSAYSENADIKGFVENNTLLVNCYEDYVAFKGAVDTIALYSRNETEYTEAKQVDEAISQLKASITIADIYKEQFKATSQAKEYANIDTNSILKKLETAKKNIKV